MKVNINILKKLEGTIINVANSPAGSWLSLFLNQIDPGEAHLTLTIRKEMCNIYGNIHGGMMALLIDESIGWAIASLDTDQFYTSVNLSIDYLYAAADGEQI